MSKVLDSTYLPFTEEQLLNHFAKAGRKCVRNEKFLSYYRDSVQRYHDYIEETPDRRGRPLSETKRPC